MSDILATKVIVSQKHGRQPTATPNSHAKIHRKETPFLTQILIVWQNSIMVAVHIFSIRFTFFSPILG